MVKISIDDEIRKNYHNRQLYLTLAALLSMEVGFLFAYSWYKTGSLKNLYYKVVQEYEKLENAPNIWQH